MSIANMLRNFAEKLSNMLSGINTKLTAKGVSEAATLSDVAARIDEISTGTDTTLDASIAASASDIVSPKKAWVNGSLVTGSISVQSGKTVTPTTSTQTAVSSGRYTTGTVYVQGDTNLVSENIKSGVTIFGVNGSYSTSARVTMGEQLIYHESSVNRTVVLLDTANLIALCLYKKDPIPYSTAYGSQDWLSNVFVDIQNKGLCWTSTYYSGGSYVTCDDNPNIEIYSTGVAFRPQDSMPWYALYEKFYVFAIYSE